MLPLVRSITSDLSLLARDLKERRSRLDALGGPRGSTTGDPYSEELEHIGLQLDEDSRLMSGYTQELQQLGVEPGDPEAGLIDYPAELDGRPIRLCWQLGEPEVFHWHLAEANCSDRRRLPADDAAIRVAPSLQ